MEGGITEDTHKMLFVVGISKWTKYIYIIFTSRAATCPENIISQTAFQDEKYVSKLSKTIKMLVQSSN